MLFCTLQQSKTPPKQCNTEKLPQKFNLTKYALNYMKYKAIPVVRTKYASKGKTAVLSHLRIQLQRMVELDE